MPIVVIPIMVVPIIVALRRVAWILRNECDGFLVLLTN